jgi:hypothetical protein
MKSKAVSAERKDRKRGVLLFLEKQVPVYIGSDSPAIRFTSLRSVSAPVRFR